MDTPSPGQIHLADQRGLTETDAYRRYSSLNYEGYFNEHRRAFGTLSVFNDEILAAGKSTPVNVNADCQLVLIPVTGSLISTVDGKEQTTEVGEVLVQFVKPSEVVEFTNPYHEDWINYLYLMFKTKESISVAAQFLFDFEGKQDQLLAVIADEKLPFSLHIGQFGGRKEALYKPRDKKSLVYNFVIAGAFEMQGRLLHERDGLALWDVDEVEMEALSNSAVILLVELLA